MSNIDDLKRIKKIYGEKFMQLCRDLFPTILEQKGSLLKILEQKFSHNCNSLYESITENQLIEGFKSLVYSEFDKNRENKEEKEEQRTPYEILDEAGYNLYECKTEDDIQSFKKYYIQNELLCTIKNGRKVSHT